MYKKVSTDMNFVEREKQVEKFWEDNQIFEKSMKVREGNPSYVFYDGPPTANGKPHIGHVETRVIKDMIPRYRTMKGYQVPRKAGWDTHGLPVELEVEKKLGLDGKDQIEKYGVEPFIEQCKESVWKYEGMWEDFSHTVGFWADMKNPYVTYHNDYIESEWWALKEIWKKGLLYEGHKIVPYCPRCGTPLSSHEVAQGYKDVKERSAVVRFKVKGEDAYILAWTTTPWTLPSNVALCVNPDEDYVKVTSKGYTYYMAAALVDTVLGEGAEILEHYQGKDLEFKEYEPLFPYAEKRIGNKKAYYVVCDTYVTLTDGTGVVHIAPAFGEDDSKVGHRYDLPFVQLVNEKGEMTEETPWAGTFCKKADMAVLQALEDKDLLFDAPLFEHSYPHCWRCDTPLIYYARETWFIRMTAVKEDLIRNNNTINWIPESIGKGRFGDWLENVQDWGLSRNRYWGTPLPVWQCECGHQDCIGSIEELKEKADNCPDDIELHRPYIDAVTIKCPKCGKEMHRVPEVIDCWFDSGSMPFAQHHYPFENKEVFEQQFPAQFISEAVDQTRGWFYSLMAESTLLFNKAPYENVIVLGHVQDENGVWRMDYADMDRKLKEHNIHFAIFCSPHNPTGRVWEREEIEKAMEIYKANECVVISDEIWSDLTLPGFKHIPTQSVSKDARERTIALYAPSKTFNLAGLVGSYHIIYNRMLRDRVEKASSLSHYNSPNVLSVHALIGAYRPEGYQWVDELREVLKSNADYAYNYILEHFKGVKLSKPEGTYMLYLDCEEWCKEHDTDMDTLLKAGVAVGVIWQDGRPFHRPYAIRLNLALPHVLVKEAFDRMDKYVFNAK